MVPNTSVAFEADEPLNVQPNASGAEALETFTEMSPGTAAPTATLAVTTMLLRAEHSALKTPSVTPFEGIVIVPETDFTPLSMIKFGRQLRLSWVWTR
jgi:hypothetical protein